MIPSCTLPQAPDPSQVDPTAPPETLKRQNVAGKEQRKETGEKMIHAWEMKRVKMMPG